MKFIAMHHVVQTSKIVLVASVLVVHSAVFAETAFSKTGFSENEHTTSIMNTPISLPIDSNLNQAIAQKTGQTIATLQTVLPPLSNVTDSLNRHPMVTATEANFRYENAHAEKLTIGEHEWTVKGGLQLRKNQRDNSQYLEQTIGVEKAFRLPKKRQADEKIGALGIQIATLTRGDAWHESAKLLLEDWFNVLTAQKKLQRLTETIALIEKQLTSIDQRIKAGDAPKMERLLIENERDQFNIKRANAQLNLSEMQLSLSRYYQGKMPVSIDLTAIQPNLVLTSDAELTQDTLQKVMADNHELELAEHHTQRLQAIAERQKLDLKPDPLLGFGYSREQGGNEHLVGVTLSLPFANKARQATVTMAESQVTMAENEYNQLKQKITVDTNARLQSVKSNARQLQLTQHLQQQTARHNALMQKAYQLGEVSLSDWLISLRQAIEVNDQVDQTQLTLASQYSRVLLDSHQLWAMPE